MKRFPLALFLLLCPGAAVFWPTSRAIALADEPVVKTSVAAYPAGEPDRSKLPDSFAYYGPNGLWWKWSDSQKIGRDTWFFYTGGTQKFYHILAKFGGDFGVTIDFFRLLDSKRRATRFREIGLINEPNFVQAADDETDEWGFRVDKWKGDPIPAAYPKNPPWYGEPTGVIGLRKFPNPDFTEALKAAWLKDPKTSVRAYLENPGKVEPPYLVGITCALCHVAFDPLNPPKDTANPRWENLAANIGNQFLREGDLFFGAGRVVGGGANPGPNYKNDPYDSNGLEASSFLYQYGHTQQPGTSETSRFSYDFINNPNTINQIINLGGRAAFPETTSTGHGLLTPHVLKDGSDSIGIQAALLRVYINIGSEGDYWADHLWNPATGTQQKPFEIKEVKGEVLPARLAELRAKYPEFGRAWHETEQRAPYLLSYLASYTPYPLKSVKDKSGKSYVSQDADQLKRGGLLYADNCARCHSNKQPFYPLTHDDDRARFYRGSVLDGDFLTGNTLTNDVRYPFNEPGFGVNAARALATNAIDNDIWADFSSDEYKALPALRFMKFENPLNRLDPSKFGPTPIVTEFVAPGGGRGYYRTAALTSMWATAPYLHNNSVGIDPFDAQGKIDPKYATIEGRLELFEAGVDQLLNPEKRPLKIKVTSSDSGLLEGMPGVKTRIASGLRDLARMRTEELFQQVLDLVVKDLKLPEVENPVKPFLKKAAGDFLSEIRPDLNKIFHAGNLVNLKADVTATLEAKLDTSFAAKLAAFPGLGGIIAEVKAKFEAAFEEAEADLTKLIQAEITIPKGTPLNLILNMNAARAPYALAFAITNQGNPRLVAEGLLKLSDCPDLVENRGHTYGSELSPAEKRDLIEFLKTL